MESPVEILKKYWGYDTFRPLQQEIINSVLTSHDTLALMPTGGWKINMLPGSCNDAGRIVPCNKSFNSFNERPGRKP